MADLQAWATISGLKYPFKGLHYAKFYLPRAQRPCRSLRILALSPCSCSILSVASASWNELGSLGSSTLAETAHGVAPVCVFCIRGSSECTSALRKQRIVRGFVEGISACWLLFIYVVCGVHQRQIMCLMYIINYVLKIPCGQWLL